MLKPWVAGVLVLAAILVAVAFTGNGQPQPASAAPEQTHLRYIPTGGLVTFDFDPDAIDTLGLDFIPDGAIREASNDRQIAFEIRASSVLDVTVDSSGAARITGGGLQTLGALLFTRGAHGAIGNLELHATQGGAWTITSGLVRGAKPYAVFEFTSVVSDFTTVPRELRLVGDLSAAPAWAAAMGLPAEADLWVGSVLVEADVALADAGAAAMSASGVAGGQTASGPALIGPDVIVAELQSVVRQGHVGDITAYAVGTTSCNLGDEPANWYSQNSNLHPVISMNMFRLKADKFEQVGLSWVKHGFYAVYENTCSQNCVLPPEPGVQLGVLCSDPYNATLNGTQTNMTPRSTVNAHTGFHPIHTPQPEPVDEIERRLQVHDADLDPDLNVGARYFVQGHYLTEDDAAAGNQDNNASYREVFITEPAPDNFVASLEPAFGTQREQPVVRAWQDVDPTVVETEIRVPDEGLFILAAKAIDLGGGVWRYSYALQNLDSDRSARSFNVPLAPGLQVTNVGFHDVDYHSGEPYSLTDWLTITGLFNLRWETPPYENSPNANALRYGTVYNFYFDTVSPPEPTTVTIDLFKPGQPTLVTADTVGPSLLVDDCNLNGTPDAEDIAAGTSDDCDSNGIPDECQADCNSSGTPDTCDITSGASADCNTNSLPDECEIDCNGNTVADECDIRDGTSTDCNGNTVPDECDPDCDGDGIPTTCDADEDFDDDGLDDCDDLCPLTTPAGVCECPATGCCDLPLFPGCVFIWPPQLCIDSDGIPDCYPGEACRDGCVRGDFDNDGDIDLKDFAEMQAGFSGPFDGPGYVAPPPAHLFAFDREGDLDIDLDDLSKIPPVQTGP